MKTIGKYQILGLLGRGGMGTVYKARHPELGHIVALKLLAPMDMVEAIVGMDELTRRFEAEARTMAGLNHENIATVWDLERDERGRSFFIMDYFCNNVGAVIGETYRVEAPSRVLRIDRAADIVRQTLEGLARLHAAGIVHRDMKPFNLLLTSSGGVRIIDFGLSKLRHEPLQLHGSEKVGSPYYAPPEQEEDAEAVGPTADLFSVGVMFQRMLTGRLPQLSCDPPSACNPDLDDDWDKFLSRAVAETPAERFQSAREMIEALDGLMDEWRARSANSCALPPELNDSAMGAEGGKGQPEFPRSEPIKTGPHAGPEALGLDELWRPRQYSRNEFKDRGDDTVLDQSSGLLWEQGASEYPLTRGEAQAYVQGLNAESYAGCSAWRLPTVEELKTLLTPVTQGSDFCVQPVFDTSRTRLWSCDRRTFIQSWSADTELGFISHHDDTCHNYARAVCSLGR
ncbi:protein kinase domain-containing protein [Desulfovibrio ferrophilus]|uniref:Serine/threonine protein kinase n=1 Tax=Desulfovibrio ferrophilus TaxID=241368 RepID=A0A2Z6B2T5_9BACT|nr:protein kinase [Desulfovibrio ferrophilus]BBD09801.1 serine/threonine protein kinase [Desulfovibrio ferrophilus]